MTALLCSLHPLLEYRPDLTLRNRCQSRSEVQHPALAVTAREKQRITAVRFQDDLHIHRGLTRFQLRVILFTNGTTLR